MLRVQYRKKGIRLVHIYFPDYSIISKTTGCDITFVHGCKEPINNGILYTQQKTLIKDLSQTEEEIFSTLGKHLRQYIKRSQKDSQIRICFYQQKDEFTKEGRLSKCAYLYEKMNRDKGQNSSFNFKLAETFIKENALIIGAAFLNDEMIGYSAVIHDDSDARLWTSAFDFRNENYDSQILSRTHQRLDWEMLLYCKNYGISQYDFGGVNSFSEPNGIAKFKMAFEKENKVEYENYLVANTLLGKVALKNFLPKEERIRK